MAVSKGLGTYGDGAGVVTPTDHKLAHLGLVTKTGAGTNAVRAGLFYDGVTTIVSGTANMSYDVAPFTAVSSRGAASGAVLFANDGTVNVVTTAAPGTNSRIDVVYAWVREFSLDGGSTTAEIGVIQGTSAASPVAPSLAAFPGAIELARITVPAGVTATNSGATITQVANFTTSDGAIIPVRNFANLPATAIPGARARTIDTGLLYRYQSSAWELDPSETVGRVTSFTPTFGGVTVGNGTLTGNYVVVGRNLVIGTATFTLDSTSAVTGSTTLTVPIGEVQNLAGLPCGNVTFVDSGTTNYYGPLEVVGSTTLGTRVLNVAGTYASRATTTGTVPFTWTTGDSIAVQFFYRSTVNVS